MFQSATRFTFKTRCALPSFPFPTLSFVLPLICPLCFIVSFGLSCLFSHFLTFYFSFSVLSLYPSLTSACPSPLVFFQSFRLHLIRWPHLFLPFRADLTAQFFSASIFSLSACVRLSLLFLPLFFSPVLPASLIYTGNIFATTLAFKCWHIQGGREIDCCSMPCHHKGSVIIWHYHLKDHSDAKWHWRIS